MFNMQEKKFMKLFNRNNWLITTNNFSEPKLIHKKYNIVLGKEDIEVLKDYCDYISHIFSCMSKLEQSKK